MSICVSINMTSLGVLLAIYPFVTAPIGYTASLCIFVSPSTPEDMLNILTSSGMHRSPRLYWMLSVLCGYQGSVSDTDTRSLPPKADRMNSTLDELQYSFDLPSSLVFRPSYYQVSDSPFHADFIANIGYFTYCLRLGTTTRCWCGHGGLRKKTAKPRRFQILTTSLRQNGG